MIKPAYSVSFLLSINIFVWQNVLYFLDAPRRSRLTFPKFSGVNEEKHEKIQPRYSVPTEMKLCTSSTQGQTFSGTSTSQVVKHCLYVKQIKVKKIKQSHYRPSGPEGSRRLRLPDL